MTSYLTSLLQSRNFALNPGQGLKISAFKDAHNNQGGNEDKELQRLARYLLFISQVDDLRKVNHSVRHTLSLKPNIVLSFSPSLSRFRVHFFRSNTCALKHREENHADESCPQEWKRVVRGLGPAP